MNAPNKWMREIGSWLMAILLPVLIIFVLNLKVFVIASVNQQSMMTTLRPGEVVYYNRFAADINQLQHEDIILFLSNDRQKQGFLDEVAIKWTDFMDAILRRPQTHERYVKRIIGLPGDVVDIRDGVVTVNGAKEARSYVRGTTLEGEFGPYPVTVPEGKLFVMGDNREVSKDSRAFGFIDIKSVEGRAVYLIWPLNRVQTIR